MSTTARLTPTMRAALATIDTDPSAPGVKGVTLEALERRELIRLEQNRDANGYATEFARWYLTDAGRAHLPVAEPATVVTQSAHSERSAIRVTQPSRPGNGTTRSWTRTLSGKLYGFFLVTMPDGEIRYEIRRYDGSPEGTKFDCDWTRLHFITIPAPVPTESADDQYDQCEVCGKTFQAVLAESVTAANQWTVHWATPLSSKTVTQSCGPEHAAQVEQRRNADGYLWPAPVAAEPAPVAERIVTEPKVPTLDLLERIDRVARNLIENARTQTVDGTPMDIRNVGHRIDGLWQTATALVQRLGREVLPLPELIASIGPDKKAVKRRDPVDAAALTAQLTVIRTVGDVVWDWLTPEQGYSPDPTGPLMDCPECGRPGIVHRDGCANSRDALSARIAQVLNNANITGGA